jgi:hypothetical protein
MAAQVDGESKQQSTLAGGGAALGGRAEAVGRAGRCAGSHRRARAAAGTLLALAACAVAVGAGWRARRDIEAAAAVAAAATDKTEEGPASWGESQSCTIAREYALSCEDFVARYMGREPVVLSGAGLPEALRNGPFVSASSSESLSTVHGDLPLRLSTANAYTGREWSEMRLDQYLREHLAPQRLDRAGNETLYLFGSQSGAGWDAFLAGYVAPTTVYPSESFVTGGPRLGAALSAAAATAPAPAAAALCGHLGPFQAEGVSLSFGVAGRGSGVPFHFHGPGFLQQLHGRKRWFLYPPGHRPRYDPNATTLHWVREELPKLPPGEKPPYDCVLDPLDVLYFPRDFYHATLNLGDYTVFIASFA